MSYCVPNLISRSTRANYIEGAPSSLKQKVLRREGKEQSQVNRVQMAMTLMISMTDGFKSPAFVVIYLFVFRVDHLNRSRVVRIESYVALLDHNNQTDTELKIEITLELLL